MEKRESVGMLSDTHTPENHTIFQGLYTVLIAVPKAVGGFLVREKGNYNSVYKHILLDHLNVMPHVYRVTGVHYYVLYFCVEMCFPYNAACL